MYALRKFNMKLSDFLLKVGVYIFTFPLDSFSANRKLVVICYYYYKLKLREH